MSLVLGLLRPDEGSIRVAGQGVRPGLPMAEVLVALPQDAELPARQRVREVLIMLARLDGFAVHAAQERAGRALERVGLSASADKRVGELSHGQRRRVGIAQTLLGDAPILLLDEPTAGLDPEAAHQIRELLREVNAERTIVWSSHNLAELEALCTHAAIIDRGRLVAEGTIAELTQRGRTASVLVGAAPAELDPLLAELRAIPGVAAARFDAQAASFELELAAADEASADAAISRALAALIARGVTVRSVERGQGLERRFIDATSATPGSTSR